ncbi:MAG: macro domain-containing protein [Thermoguttaceae bacterium]|jgi:O-acetyl-ADP-ribose deacetylase (regulator of RNase III)|nr:macro domain-containing protein [Thermoguttaceae bacterium]
MIEFQKGDILQANAEALINTVNCVGVMGRGIALQFKKAFPENFDDYEEACKRGEVRPGKMFVVRLSQLQNPRYIINFPTKRHWKGNSRIEDIEAGLDALLATIRELGVKSIAVPPLGCGLGGLDWRQVRRRIEQTLGGLTEVQVLVYEPCGAPASDAMARTNNAPNMTPGRAALLGLMRRYLSAVMDPYVSLLEMHKLMYFMQEAGERLRLRFAKGPYGPYAENLRHVLTEIEGHFINGFGDAEDDPEKQIELVTDVSQRAERFLQKHPQTRAHFDRVGELIRGFETPYGMELLSTVHWVAKREAATNADRAVEKVYAWNPRKQLFREPHIRMAWQVLEGSGWLCSE